MIEVTAWVFFLSLSSLFSAAILPRTVEAAEKDARCLRSGIWLSTEYVSKVLQARVNNFPDFLSLQTDRTTLSFRRSGRFLLESYFIFAGEIDGDYIESASEGQVDSRYRVRTQRDGTSFLSFHTVTLDRISTMSQVNDTTVGPTVQEGVHDVDKDRVPFTCRRDRLTLKIRNQNGEVVRVYFRRVR